MTNYAKKRLGRGSGGVLLVASVVLMFTGYSTWGMYCLCAGGMLAMYNGGVIP